MKKNILVYYDSMHPKGGVERVIANLFNNLSEFYRVTLLTTDDTFSSYSISKKIDFISMNHKRVLDMEKSKIYRIYKILTTIKFNVNYLKGIIDNYDYVYVATPLTALEVYLIGKKIRKKIVVSEHASFYAGNILYKIVRKFIYPKLPIISVPTKMDNEIYQTLGCNSIYIPHLSTFNVQNIEKSNNKIALNVGRLTSDKQQLLLLEIWNELFKANQLNGWKLKIIGEGELYDKLNKYIYDNNLEACVLPITSTNQIEKIYKTSDLFLFASKMEGFGMVLIEAMAYGLPCISFDCPSGPRDIIKNGENGFLVDCYDKQVFKERIQQIISNDDLYQNLSGGALWSVKNWDNEEILIQWREKIFK